MAGAKAQELNWNTISEENWNPFLRSFFPPSCLQIVRVYPASRAYQEIVKLRYAGLVETGFINPETMDLSCMELDRDVASIILGLFKNTNRAIGSQR